MLQVYNCMNPLHIVGVSIRNVPDNVPSTLQFAPEEPTNDSVQARKRVVVQVHVSGSIVPGEQQEPEQENR